MLLNACMPLAACSAVPPAGHLPAARWHVVCQARQSSCEQPGQPDISLLAPHLQLQWVYAANVHLGGVIVRRYSHRSVWWVCDQCPAGHSHQWQAEVSRRSSGSGCPQCVGRKVCQHNSLAFKAPDVAKNWNHSNNTLTPDTVLANSSSDAEWLCDVCGHEWTMSPSSRVGRNHGCAQCNAGG